MLLDIEGPVTTITLNRPDAMNAMTVEMIEQFVGAVDRIDADDDVRCVIVTGAGRQFSRVPTWRVATTRSRGNAGTTMITACVRAGTVAARSPCGSTTVRSRSSPR